MSRELVYPHILQERILLAATKAGHANAMIANLHLAGTAAKAAIWESEMAVWQARRDKLIGEMPIKSTVTVLAEKTFSNAQISKIVPAHELAVLTAEVQ